jgi:hypothetical protein
MRVSFSYHCYFHLFIIDIDQRASSFGSRVRSIMTILKHNQEFIIGPAITLVPQLFLLPKLVVTMLLRCQSLDDSFLRYLLIAAMWMTCLPQSVSFWLHITPSSFFMQQWRHTKTSKWLRHTLSRHSPLARAAE